MWGMAINYRDVVRASHIRFTKIKAVKFFSEYWGVHFSKLGTIKNFPLYCSTVVATLVCKDVVNFRVTQYLATVTVHINSDG